MNQFVNTIRGRKRGKKESYLSVSQERKKKQQYFCYLTFLITSDEFYVCGLKAWPLRFYSVHY